MTEAERQAAGWSCPARKQDSAGDLQVIRASGGVRVLVDQAAQDGFSADVLCADAGHRSQASCADQSRSRSVIQSQGR